MTSARRPGNEIDRRLQEVFDIHFDPDMGTPYWLEQAARWGFDPRREIKAASDLPRLGLMDQEALRERPLTDFLPRSLHESLPDLIVVQTGGTLGKPIWTAYSEEEFHEAFVAPFVEAASHVGFPTGGNWLYAGPSGPHVIGQAAVAIARATGSPMPFAVDFDARWAKKLPAESFAAERYRAHVVEQSMEIFHRQSVSTIFTTPLILHALADAMSAEQRERILGVHYGGMAIGPEELAAFQTRWFPNAVHLSGYGNTLFGCCLELDAAAGRPLRYYPRGERLLFGVLPETAAPDADAPRYGEAGLKGRLIFSRLDRTSMILNLAERDCASLVDPPPDAPAAFHTPGASSPVPHRANEKRSSMGLY